MKHEDYRIRYNEIMFDERDMIKKFLEKTADIRYGNQMFEYTLEPMVEVISVTGLRVKVREVVLNDDGDVTFLVYPYKTSTMERWECSNFALGELSKIIDALPEADDFIYKDAQHDLRMLCRQCDDNTIDLEECPFSWKSGNSTFTVHTVFVDAADDKLNYEICEQSPTVPDPQKNGWGVWEELSADNAKALARHIKRHFLRDTKEYKQLRNLLLEHGRPDVSKDQHYFLWSEDNIPSVSINYQGVEFAVVEVFLNVEEGSMFIYTHPVESRIGNEYTFHEHDLTAKELKPVLEAIEQFLKSKKSMEIRISEVRSRTITVPTDDFDEAKRLAKEILLKEPLCEADSDGIEFS